MSVLHLSRLETKLAYSDRGSKMSNGPMNSWKAAPRKWRSKAPRRSWDLLVKSSSGPSTKKPNQDHFLEKPTQLAAGGSQLSISTNCFFYSLWLYLSLQCFYMLTRKNVARNKAKYNSSSFTASFVSTAVWSLDELWRLYSPLTFDQFAWIWRPRVISYTPQVQKRRLREFWFSF